MALFSKRLTCFYCGGRSSQPTRGPVRKFHCDRCEADNYLDENGEITDPPASDTNAAASSPGKSSPSFESTEFQEPDLFCSKCQRNQHLFTHSLANYFPPTDDPSYPEYERNYDQYRRGLEDRYPQVCETCEPRVRERIRQTQYDAKADHLRRMMEQTRAGKAARRARNSGWRSLLVFTGACGYWASIIVQLAWNVMVAMTSVSTLNEPDTPLDQPSLISCVMHTAQTRRIPSDCTTDLAPVAGPALIVGILSLWWNPKLRMKVEGRPGRFARLGEYYQVQLIVLVARCVFWALLKDTTANDISPALSPILHMSMAIFTILSVVVSRQVIKYDTKPLVNWADNSWEKRPMHSGGTSPVSHPRLGTSPNATNISPRPQFPIDKLADALPSVTGSPAVPPAVPPTPPPKTDDMDWTPSTPQHLQPVRSVHQRDQPSVLNGPLPFYGSLPPAPTPPAWRSRAGVRSRPVDQVVERNPFHRSPAQLQNQWQHKSPSQDVVFRPPNFFPQSDYNTSNELNGLDDLFDRTLDMGHKDAPQRDWTQPASGRNPNSGYAQGHLIYQYLRLGSLMGSVIAWTFSQNRQLLPGIHIEAFALGCASLIAGFSLLEALKRPLMQWNGMEILIYFTELGAVIILGGHLPQASLEREYFDRYGKLLLLFMIVQESLALLNLYRVTALPTGPQDHPPTSPFSTQPGSPKENSPRHHALPWSPTESSASSTIHAPSFDSQSSAPPLSFSTSIGSSTGLSSALPPAQQYRLPLSQSVNSFSSRHNKNPHSFTMSSLKESEVPSDYEQDSDSETVATTATNLTDATTRDIRYGRNSAFDYNSPFSPRRSELGPGFGGLSLEDRPASRRITRSQTQHGLTGRRYPGRAIR